MPGNDRKSNANAGIGAGYAAFQLSRALAAAGLDNNGQTSKRVERWRNVIKHISDESASYGSRTPVADVPEWVTLEVATGGFATGQFMAGGELTEYERRLAASIQGIRPGFERLDLNSWHLTEEGIEVLQAKLASSDYRVEVPEEAALLTVAWLLGQNRIDNAWDLVEAIAPFFVQLRFFPMASDGLPLSAGQVQVCTVGDIRTVLSNRPAQKHFALQKHVVETRLPLYDSAVSLFLLTYQDDWPCRRYPEGWFEQASTLKRKFDASCPIAQYEAENSRDRAGELFALLGLCASDAASLTGRQVGRIRRIVDDFVRKHGHPESESHVKSRETQRTHVSASGHHLIAKAVAERLNRYSESDGVSDFSSLLQSITSEEAAEYSLVTGAGIPPAVRRRVERCQNGTVEELIEKGLITSGDTVARLLPAITAEIYSAGFRDTPLRILSVATYRAFRRRRSLLLLDLQTRVKMNELPWVAAVEDQRETDAVVAETAKQFLIESAAMTLCAFPQAILPNKLIQEFAALAAMAKLELPFVEEVASDIFMGAFSNKYIRAARQAASLIGGTLYANYYDIDASLLAMLPDQPKSRRKRFSRPNTSSRDALARLCAQRADERLGTWRPATNGKIIEQQQILTTQNLSLLFGELGLKALLQHRLASMAEECFRWICKRQQMKLRFYHSSLVVIKNTAYAWRQMVFYLAMLDETERRYAIERIEAHFAIQPGAFRERFLPAIRGLRVAASGAPLTEARQASEGAQVFIGWTTERHWLLKQQTNGVA
ncbi:hypothetical protein [Pseudomonas sp. H3_G09]